MTSAGTAKGEPVNEPVNIVSFADDSEWRIINDGVMGGLSRSRIQSTDQGTGLFTGELSLENNGGFASIRTLVGSHDLSQAAGLEIRVKGDGRTYQLRLRTTDRWDGIAYRASFRAPEGRWFTARFPFEDFVPSFRGRVVEDAGPLDAARIEQLGFLIADKVTEPFSLEIDFVRAWHPGREAE